MNNNIIVVKQVQVSVLLLRASSVNWAKLLKNKI